jgi:hypothetical protein
MPNYCFLITAKATLLDVENFFCALFRFKLQCVDLQFPSLHVPRHQLFVPVIVLLGVSGTDALIRTDESINDW